MPCLLHTLRLLANLALQIEDLLGKGRHGERILLILLTNWRHATLTNFWYALIQSKSNPTCFVFTCYAKGNPVGVRQASMPYLLAKQVWHGLQTIPKAYVDPKSSICNPRGYLQSISLICKPCHSEAYASMLYFPCLTNLATHRCAFHAIQIKDLYGMVCKYASLRHGYALPMPSRREAIQIFDLYGMARYT